MWSAHLGDVGVGAAPCPVTATGVRSELKRYPSRRVVEGYLMLCVG